MKRLLRLGGTFLIAGAGLLTVADAEAAARMRDSLLLVFAVPVVVLWLGTGFLMAGSLASEASWDEETLYLAFAFETRAVSWSDVLGVRVLIPRGWPTRRAAAFVLLTYKRPIRGQQRRSWALLAVGQDRTTQG